MCLIITVFLREIVHSEAGRQEKRGIPQYLWTPHYTLIQGPASTTFDRSNTNTIITLPILLTSSNSP